ncbi:MAG: TlpA family protein disulfide reductase [Acidobacteriota bacterium]|nr:TlpA family protein disulfide reductase [Acidobacteriota bacterium]
MLFSFRQANRALLFLAAFTLLILPACNSSTATGKKEADKPAAATSGNKTTAAKYDPTAVPPEMADSEMTALDGKTFKIADYKGKVLLINVWTTWCGYCKKQMPDLVALSQEFKDRDVEFIGLNAENEKLPMVQEYVKTHSIPYRVAWANEDVLSVLSPNGFPSTYLITRNGNFHWAVNGFVPPERIRTKIQEALEVN